MQPIVIIGAGGYAQEVLWIIEEINKAKPVWEFLGFIDPAAPHRKRELLCDFPILGGFEAGPLPKALSFACGIGSPSAREKECSRAEAHRWQPAALLHPSVIVARHVEIGVGTVVGAGSILAPYAKLGRHCAINVHVSIGHNSSAGDFCVLSPGARLSGCAVLEDRVFIGTNASVYQGQRIGAGASLGANSFQVTGLERGSSSIGVPAREFRSSFGKVADS